MEPAPPDPTWLQWLAGSWAAFTLGVFWHLYSRVEKAQNPQGIGDIWEAIDGLRKDMAQDRAVRAEERVSLAERVVTRSELREEIDRLIRTLDSRLGASQR